MSKPCIKCHRVLPVDEFYRHPAMADGRLNKCKECQRADVKAAREKNREHYSAYEQDRQQTPDRRAAKVAAMTKHRLNNPEKAKARHAVSNAVRDGKLTRLPCVHCGNPKSQAHHHDYSKPLEVTWACFKCHREIEHGQVVIVADW